MKLVSFISILALVCTANGAFAKSKSTADTIPALAKELGVGMFGSDSITRLKEGNSSFQLLAQKYMKDNKLTKVDEDFDFTANVKSIQESDGTGLGTATASAAQDLVDSSIVNQSNTDKDGNELTQRELSDKRASALDLMKRLKRAGAEFGYDSNGSGVCGVNFTTLLIIDVDAKTIHEVAFVSGPC